MNRLFLLLKFGIFSLVTVLVTENAVCSDVKIIKSNDLELQFEITPQLLDLKKYTTKDGSEVIFPMISNSKIKEGKPGSPIEIIQTINFAIPDISGYKIEHSSISELTLIDGIIAPVPISSIENDIAEKNYEKNEQLYKNHPLTEWVSVRYGGIATDVNVAELNVVVARYNQFSNKIQLPNKILINISFKPTSNPKIAFNRPNYEFLINPLQAQKWGIQTETPPNKDKETLQNESNNKISEISNGKWLKLTINETGVYKITASQLSSNDINISPNELKTIKIFSKGGIQLDETVSSALTNYLDEQEIIVNTNSNGSLESIVFMGLGTKGFKRTPKGISSYFNEYTNSSFYLLTFGGKDGLRCNAIPNSNETPVNMPENYTNRIYFDEEINNPYDIGAGRQWFGRSYFSSPFVNQLHNLDRSGKVFYRIAVAHRSYSISGVTNGDAQFEYYDNNILFGKENLYGISGYTNSRWEMNDFTLPAQSIASDNRSILKLQYINEKNPNGSIPYLDFFEIHYPRPFLAINNDIEFIADTLLNGLTEFKINGFSGNILGFDITEPSNPKLLTNRSNTGGMIIFNSNLDPQGFKRYYISSAFKTAKIEKASLSLLRENFANTDVIVITHKDLLASAEKFKAYREANSDLKVSIFTTDDIYNEFGMGSPDVTAIRDFVAYSYKNWTVKPKYLVLWGDGHYDFKNISTNKTNFVPAYQTADFGLRYYESTQYSFCTDDFYGRIIGNDYRVDIAVGRIPADSPESGNWLVDKINHYEHNSSTDSWRTNLLLVADDGPQANGNPPSNDGAVHTVDSEKLIPIISNDIQIEKIYMVEYPSEKSSLNDLRKPKVTQDLLSTINTSGTLIMNYNGHGNPRVWAHESILDRETTIPQMRNLDKLFFLTAATCDFGRFDLTDIKSGSEEMLYSKVGGAIAVLAFTRVVFISDNAALNKVIYSNLFKRDIKNGKYLTIGDVIYNVKQNYFDIGDQKLVVLGDPTMRLLLPEHIVRVDSINGHDVSSISSPLQIKGLSKVSVKASVLNPLTMEVDNQFNGSALITMRDGDQYFEILEIDPRKTTIQNLFVFNKFGGALNKSSATVTNGLIESEFIIPKDISFSDSLGRIFIYAVNESKTSFAKGSNHNFIINGIDNTQKNDNKGPNLDIFLDSRNFVQNDVVSSKPLLIVDYFDENGINTTGIGIGHRLEAWIDNDPIPLDLTAKFKSSTVDARYGSTEDILYNLSEGLHVIKVRAWDVFNNYTTNSTTFRISPVNSGPVIKNIYNYPNPYRDATTIRFNHDITPPFDAELRIYNSLGVLIKSIKQRLGTLNLSEIQWDGLDNEGYICPVGAYYFSITASNNNNSSTEFGTISVMIR